MSRGLIIFVIIVGGMAAGIYFAVPALKERFIGDTLQVRVKYFKAYDDLEVAYKDGTIARTVVDLEISFPMNTSPEHVEDLEVRDEKGQPLKDGVFFDQPVIKEDYDKKVTRWRMNIYLPYLFRGGKLRTKTHELIDIRFPQKLPFDYPAGI